VTRSAKIIVPTNAVKDDLTDFYHIDNNKIEVIYEGVKKLNNLSKSSSYVLNKYNLTGKKYFIYVGNAYPHKNLERAVEALMYVNEKRNEKVYLAIASSRNKFTNTLKKYVSSHRAGEYVSLLGFVPDEFVEILYSKSVGFLYPSTAEGFGLPGLEAMHAETLLLASNIPVFKEVYGKNAIYFNPHDFSSIGLAIEESLNISANLREKRIKTAREFVNKYSWRKMAEDTHKIYMEIGRG
jgi:glycosyltransferase involved in cell wall biosynthesis